MKICIIGYSGSGKSTLAKRLGSFYNIPILHLDSVNFLPGWEVRDTNEMNSIVDNFLESNESWVIDGNYSKVGTKRFDMCDQIIFLNYNRFTCLKGVMKRYKDNKGKTRIDMAEGCDEKLDFPFLWWVFHEGRNYKRRKRLYSYTTTCKNHFIFKNRKQLNKYLTELGLTNLN